MAIIYPNDIHDVVLAEAHSGELNTLEQLKNKLPKEFSVFHGAHWTNEGNTSTRFGELDFVVVNPNGDVLVIEQKNGAINETSNGLFKSYALKDKSIPDQIQRAITNVRDKYSKQNDDGLIIDYLLYCPDYKIKNINAAGIDRKRIVDARHNLVDDIKRIHSTDKVDKEKYRRVMDFFKGTFQVQPDIHQYIDSQERTYARLQNGLCNIIRNLEMKPFRLRIRGTAGSGKSEVASEYLLSEAERGRKVLLLVFNRPLAELIKNKINGKGVVDTWYGLCDRFLISRGYEFDYRKINEPSFWKDMLDTVMVESMSDEWLFDTIIVDEGQDFQAEWVDVLELFMKKNANLLWLEDINQNIRYSESLNKLNLVTYNANTNYRTPRSITSFIQKVVPVEFDCANNLPGLGVGVTAYENEEEQFDIVESKIKELIKTGFDIKEIVIITLKGVNNSVFSDKERLGKWSLKQYIGYEGDQQKFSDGNLYFESIGRYKGQQAPAVILVDVDPKDNDHSKKLLFTAMTRATVRLDIIVKNSNKIRKSMQKAS